MSDIEITERRMRDFARYPDVTGELGATPSEVSTLLQKIDRLRAELAVSREREARMREAFCGVETSQFMTDVVTAAGLLEHGKKDKALAYRIAEAAFKLKAIAFSEGAQG